MESFPIITITDADISSQPIQYVGFVNVLQLQGIPHLKKMDLFLSAVAESLEEDLQTYTTAKNIPGPSKAVTN